VKSDGQSFDSVARYSSDGALDTSFGNAGRWRETKFGELALNSAALGSDDKLVLLNSGEFFRTAELRRVTSQGTLDESFGTDGVVTTDVGTDWFKELSEVAVEP